MKTYWLKRAASSLHDKAGTERAGGGLGRIAGIDGAGLTWVAVLVLLGCRACCVTHGVSWRKEKKE
eukprot:662591-Pelagomonas_calceolata.AAC.2